MRVEEGIQIKLFEYLAKKHPNVVALSEPSGLRVSQGMAKKLKRMRSADVHLDVYILQPTQKYAGLILELKAKDIFKKTNPSQLLANKHHQDQLATINKLNKLGYYATFAIGYDQAVNVIEDYLNNRL